MTHIWFSFFHTNIKNFITFHVIKLLTPESSQFQFMLHHNTQEVSADLTSHTGYQTRSMNNMYNTIYGLGFIFYIFL